MTGPQPKATVTKARAIELRRAGIRNVEIAQKLHLCQAYVSTLLRGCGVPLPGPTKREMTEREEAMATMYRAGKTLQEIGTEYGITRERVRQILRKFGIAGDLGGSRLIAFVRESERRRAALERKAARVAKTEAYFGCCHAEVIRICGEEFAVAPWIGMKKNRKSPGGAYMNQRRNAETRKIGWELSLPDWWRIWQESGHWEQRGRGKGYCMARRGDSGPYSVNNVYICTIGQNFSDSYLVHPWHERFPNIVRADPNKLSDLQQAALRLRNSGLKIREVAAHLHRPVGTINWELYDARAKLARLERLAA